MPKKDAIVWADAFVRERPETKAPGTAGPRGTGRLTAGTTSPKISGLGTGSASVHI